MTLEFALSVISRGFYIHEIRQTPEQLILRVFPRLSHDESFNLIVEDLKARGLYPFYRQKNGEYWIFLRRIKPRELKLSPLLHFALGILTFGTVTLAGYLHWAKGIKDSLLFSISLLTILLSHELGHYIMARAKGERASLPFFLPVPPNIFPFGTLGAVITMTEPLRDRKTLIRVGIVGPVSGFLVSLPFIYIGLMHSSPYQGSIEEEALVFGMPLAMQLIARVVLGNLDTIDAHPIAMAGWIGLFVTALNLMPLGQLDGGHVIRALLPRNYTKVFRGFFLLLLISGLVVWAGWFFWALIVYLLTRLRHPGPLNDVSPLSTEEKALALVYGLLLVLCIAPVPFLPAEMLR